KGGGAAGNSARAGAGSAAGGAERAGRSASCAHAPGSGRGDSAGSAGRGAEARAGAVARRRITGGRPRGRGGPSQGTGRNMRKGRWILAGLVVALVGFATVMGLRPKAPPPVEVTTSAAKKGTVTRVVTAAGHLQARETVK